MSVGRQKKVGSEECSRISIGDAHLLIDCRSGKTDALCPSEIEEVTESREEPDAELVATKTSSVDFAIRQISSESVVEACLPTARDPRVD